MKKLIPAIVMLLVSAVVLSTASYAWFTTAQDVSASGMKVTATAPTSVLIDGQLTAGYTGNYTSSIAFDQTSKKLYAASSADGINFFEAEKCTDSTGSIEFGSNIKAVTNPTGTNGATAYCVQYKVKLINTSADNSVEIYLKDVTLGGNSIKNAVRIAIIDQTGASKVFNPASYDAAYDGTFVSYPTNDQGATARAQGPFFAASGDTKESGDEYTWAELAAGKANAYAAVDATVATLPAFVADDTVDAAASYAANAQEITIVIWFEGQSSSCITRYAGQSAEIDIVFGMKAAAGQS